MGNGKYKVTKQKWYGSSVKVEVFPVKNKEDRITCYRSKNSNVIKKGELIKKFKEKNNSLTNKLKNDKLFKNDYHFILNTEGKYFQKGMATEKSELYRRFKINENDTFEDLKERISSPYKEMLNEQDSYYFRTVVEENKTPGQKKPSKHFFEKRNINDMFDNEHYFFIEMIPEEKKLVLNRQGFIEEMNSAVGNKLKKILFNTTFYGAKVELERESNKPLSGKDDCKLIVERIKENKSNKILEKHAEEILKKINKFNLSKGNLTENYIHLIDSKSNYNGPNKTIHGVQVAKIILDFISLTEKEREKNKIIYMKLILDYLNSHQEDRILDGIFGFSRSNINKKKTKLQMEKIELKDIRNDVKKYLINKGEYNLNNLHQKLKKIKIKSYNSNDFPYLSAIKKHYIENYIRQDEKFEDSKKRFYTKEIHQYVLGRARKLRNKFNSGELKEANWSTVGRLFSEDELIEKITNSISNKKKLKKLSEQKLRYYSTSNNHGNKEVSNQVIKMVNTFNSMLNNSVYQAIRTGIAEVIDTNDIFIAKDMNTLETIIDKAVIEKYFKERGLGRDNFINNIKGAYLLRNFVLHEQQHDKQQEGTVKYKENFRLSFKNKETDMSEEQTNSSYLKEIISEFKTDQLLSNGCLHYFSKEILKDILKHLNFDKEKPFYFPRFSKIYNHFQKSSYYQELGTGEKPTEKQAYFYLFNLCYIHGLEKDLFKDSKGYIKKIFKRKKEKIDEKIQILKKEKKIENNNNKIKTINAKITGQKDIKDSLDQDFRLIKEQGLYEYKTSKVIGCSGDVSEVRRVEKQFIKLLADVFKLYCENYFDMEELPKDTDNIVLDNIEEEKKNIQNTICENIDIPKELDNNDYLQLLFTKSIYSTLTLGNIQLLNSLKGRINKFLMLIDSLGNKYSSNSVEAILDEILKELNILSNENDVKMFKSDLNKLIKIIDYKILIYNYNSNKEFSSVSHVEKDIETEIIRALENKEENELGKYTLRDITGIEKPIFTLEAKQSGQDDNFNVLEYKNIKFLMDESKQRTLKYLITLHAHICKEMNITFYELKPIIDTFNSKVEEDIIKKYQRQLEKLNVFLTEAKGNKNNQKKDKEEESKKYLSEFMDDGKSISLIELYMKSRNRIQELFKISATGDDKEKTRNKYLSHFETLKSNQNKEEKDLTFTFQEVKSPIDEKVIQSSDKFEYYAKILEELNNRINLYNFYRRLVTLNQLKNNKNLMESLYSRMFAWLSYAEQTGVIMQYESNNKSNGNKKETSKKEAFKFVEKMLTGNKTEIICQKSKIFEKFENIRNALCHLDSTQRGIVRNEEHLNSPHRDLKRFSVFSYFNSFNYYNSYSTKKRNEVDVVRKKILERNNIKEKVTAKDKNNVQYEYSSRFNAIYNCENNFPVNLTNIHEKEVEYLIRLLTIDLDCNDDIAKYKEEYRNTGLPEKYYQFVPGEYTFIGNNIVKKCKIVEA